MQLTNATQEDVQKIVELGVLMFQESPHYRRFDIDGGKIFDLVTYLIDNDDGIVILCKDDTGEIVGGFMGSVGEMWFGHARVLCDNALFIHPAHRGGMTAANLLREAFKQAKEIGAVEAQITNTTGVYSAQVERLYQYVGMTHIGGYYYIGL